MSSSANRPGHILPLIVVAQFAGTSLWFTGNAILPELKISLGLSQYAVSYVTSAVMIGFVAGTLVFALLSLADRFSPTRLFFASSLAGAFCNSAIIVLADDAGSLFVFRFFTGFFIAGIYPVGMKIAADWFEKGLGKALGFLLGALVLGTAFPHLLRNRDFDLPWKSVLICTSLFAIIGGLLMKYFVGDGPFRKTAGRFQWNAIPAIFSSAKWRQAAAGYFGHMWELYTFWGFTPLLLSLYSQYHNYSALNIPLLSFIIIAIGGIGCVIGGYLSIRFGSARVGIWALSISGACCLLLPVVFVLPPLVFIFFLLIWGFTVCPDSPQFSTLVAQHAPEQLRGTALTIYNSIGFSISTISLILFDFMFHSNSILGGQNAFVVLGLGGIFGVPFILRFIRHR